MEKPGSHTKFWETYRVYSLLLLFPALLMFALSLMIYSGDDPEYYDRQTRKVSPPARESPAGQEPYWKAADPPRAF